MYDNNESSVNRTYTLLKWGTVVWGAFLVSGCSPSFAAALLNFSQPLWQAKIADAAFTYQYKAGSLTRENVLWIAFGRENADRRASPPEYMVQKIDAQGKTLAHFNLTQRLHATEGGERYRGELQDIAAWEDGGVIAAVTSGTGDVVLARFTAEGQIVSLWPLLAPDRSGITIQKVLTIQPNHVTVLGGMAGEATALTMDHTGTVVSKIVIENSEIYRLMDGIALPQGRLVLLGKGPSKDKTPFTWIGQYSAEGELESEQVFPSRTEAFAATATGDGFFFLYDVVDAGVRRVFLRKYSSGLKEEWQVRLLEAKDEGYAVKPLKVVGTGDGGALVATLDGYRVNFYEYRLFLAWVENGKVLRSGYAPPNRSEKGGKLAEMLEAIRTGALTDADIGKVTFPEVILNFDLFYADGAVTLPMTMFVYNVTAKTSRNEIQVIRTTLK